MKPQELQSPYPKPEDRKTIICDRIWYISDSTTNNEFAFPGWSDPLLFGNNNPIHLEFCSGNGSWIADKALSHPDKNWIALEKKFGRVRKIWAKIKNQNIPNLIVICGEALFTSTTYFPPNFVEQVYINFPDPWPKRRHAKNRLIQQNFISEIERILFQNKNFFLVTDDQDYSKQFIKEMNIHKGFKAEFESGFTTECPEYGKASYFEELWREQGKTIHYHQYKKARNEQ